MSGSTNPRRKCTQIVLPKVNVGCAGTVTRGVGLARRKRFVKWYPCPDEPLYDIPELLKSLVRLNKAV